MYSISEYGSIHARATSKKHDTYDQVAVLARLVTRLVTAAGHPAAIAKTSAASDVEQPPVQILVAAPDQTPAAAAAAVAASLHAPRRVPDAGEQARRRIPVPALVRTVAPDQLVARPVAPDPRFP